MKKLGENILKGVRWRQKNAWSLLKREQVKQRGLPRLVLVGILFAVLVGVVCAAYAKSQGYEQTFSVNGEVESFTSQEIVLARPHQAKLETIVLDHDTSYETATGKGSFRDVRVGEAVTVQVRSADTLHAVRVTIIPSQTSHW